MKEASNNPNPSAQAFYVILIPQPRNTLALLWGKPLE